MTGRTDFGHSNYDREVLDDGMSFDEQREFMQYYFNAFKKIYNLEYEIDDPIVSELIIDSQIKYSNYSQIKSSRKLA